ncbi:hypothetical protein B0J12DRAFT_31815 [Macrophomina phaseolina]|uniref:Uncharacterized protein n=1 Tax=Macrophomina phaseolina TaxID=35725 RepID=A0ABQ8GYC5_9PEZI|nr:hypothetical protein B0J12DRAFT_31815 [Macrophomina phaseolina]
MCRSYFITSLLPLYAADIYPCSCSPEIRLEISHHTTLALSFLFLYTYHCSSLAQAPPSFANATILFPLSASSLPFLRHSDMSHYNAFRSHAFCKPRFLDGQGDDITGKEPTWKGTVASRIRSLNDRDNAVRINQRAVRAMQESQEGVTPLNRPKYVSYGAPEKGRSEESYDSSNPAGRTNPFVRHTPAKPQEFPSKPGLPERVSHSNVVIRSPVPNVVVQRPTFFGNRAQPEPLPATRDVANSDKDTNSGQVAGWRPAGNTFPGAGSTSPAPSIGRGSVRSVSPNYAQTTARRFEGPESKEAATNRGGTETQGELWSRNHAPLSGIESLVRDIETTSAGIEATAREISTVAHRIGLLSSSRAISSTEARSTGSRMSGVEPHPHEKLQGRPLRAQAPPAGPRMRRDTPDDTISKDDHVTGPFPEWTDSIDAVLAEHDGVLDNVIQQLQACGQRLLRIRSLSQQFSPLSRGGSSVIGQRDSASTSLSVAITAEPSVAPHASTASLHDPPAFPRYRTRSVPNLMRFVGDAGDKSTLNLKQPEEEKFKEMMQELHRTDDAPHLDVAAAEVDPISPGELQRLLSKSIAVSPTPPQSPAVFLEGNHTRLPRLPLLTTLPIPVTPPSPQSDGYGSPSKGRHTTQSSPCPKISSRSSGTRRHHSRQPSSYLSAKRGIGYPITPIDPTVSWLDSLQPTPEVYFPYQHLKVAGHKHIDSSLSPKTEQGSYCPVFPTTREEPKGPIIKAPDTPPPPPPLLSMKPETEPNKALRGPISQAMSPRIRLTHRSGTVEYLPSSADLARAAAKTAIEREHRHLIQLSTVSPQKSISEQSFSSVANEGRSDSSAVRSIPHDKGHSCSSQMPSKESSISGGSSRSHSSSNKQTTTRAPSRHAERNVRRPKPPLREATHRVLSPTSFLYTSTTSSSSSSREASTSPSPSGSLPLPKPPRQDSAHAVRNPLEDLTPQPQPLLAQPAAIHPASLSNVSVSLYPDSPLLIQPSPSHSPETMATLVSATTTHGPANQPRLLPTPLPLLSPLPSPQGAITLSKRSNAEPGAAPPTISTPRSSSTNLPLRPPTITFNPSSTASSVTDDVRSQADTTSSIAGYKNLVAPTSGSPCKPIDAGQQQQHHYPPLNVLDRVLILEEARSEKMRILRATGAHDDVVRRFSVDSGASSSNVGGISVGSGGIGTEASRDRVVGLKLGGPREQIAGLERPWW